MILLAASACISQNAVSAQGFSVSQMRASGEDVNINETNGQAQESNKEIFGYDDPIRADTGHSWDPSGAQIYDTGKRTTKMKRKATYMDVLWTRTSPNAVLPKTVSVKFTSTVEAKITQDVIAPLTWNNTTVEVLGGWGETGKLIEETTPSEGNVKRRVVQDEPRIMSFSTAGAVKLSEYQYKLRIPLDMAFESRIAGTYPVNPSGSVPAPKFRARIDVMNTLDPRSLQIDSSTIETSYSFGQTDNASGYPQNPRTPHVRDGSGAIVTDSVAKWLYEKPNGTPVGSWYGGGIFAPNLTGYSSVMPGRTFTWSLQGGSATGEAAPIFDGQMGGSSPIDVRPRPAHPVTPADGSLITGIYLGGQQYGKPLTKQSTIKLKVKDGGGVAGDGAIAENTFVINWHAPAENYAFQSQTLTPAAITLADKDSGATTVNAGSPLSYALRPNQTDWDIPKIASAGSSLLGAAGSAAVIFGIATDGVGFAVIGLLAAAGGTYGGSVEATPAPTKYPVETGYATYRSNLSKQVGTGLDTGNYSDGTPRVQAASPQVLEALTNAPNSQTTDPYWNGTNGSFQVKGRLQRNKRTRNWKYEEYDEHGFVGLTPAHTYDWIIIGTELTYTYAPKSDH